MGKTRVGEIISDRLAALGYRSENAFARENGVAQATFNALINGTREPEKVDAVIMMRILRGLRWTREEFEVITGRPLPLVAEAEALVAHTLPQEVSPNWMGFPVYSAISAGTGVYSEAIDTAYIPLEHLKANAVNIATLRVFLVNGDCMISDEAMKGKGSISPGDYVAVDPERAVKPDDIVVFWDGEDEVMLIKRVYEEDDHLIFYSAKPGLPPIVRRKEAIGQILGPVVWRGGAV